MRLIMGAPPRFRKNDLCVGTNGVRLEFDLLLTRKQIKQVETYVEYYRPLILQSSYSIDQDRGGEGLVPVHVHLIFGPAITRADQVPEHLLILAGMLPGDLPETPDAPPMNVWERLRSPLV